MKLTHFQIRNYRSINDSGKIDVHDRTVLVGRNESGKTNLLLALGSLNPPVGIRELSQVKDFPRDRPFNSFHTKIPVVETWWRLSDSEQEALSQVYPSRRIDLVRVGRRYGTARWVSLEVPSAGVPHETVAGVTGELERSVNASLRSLPASKRKNVKDAVVKLRERLGAALEMEAWAEAAEEELQAFDSALANAGLKLSDNGKGLKKKLVEIVNNLATEKEKRAAARKWILSRVPTLIYINDYPQLDGHQDVSAYLQRKRDDELTAADLEFEKLLKVAGLDAKTLNRLLSEDHEARQQMANRAAAVVTKKIRKLWTDRELKVRFNLDAEHFDTLISDSTSVYDVEINLNERSLGFRWFFSFYIGFAADTQGGGKEDAVLLMDEPGLHLHAIAQRDLLNHFEDDFDNQIIYTTHSPFMIPVGDIAAVRTVNISAVDGTTVTNDPTGDDRTLFPLQTALGYTLTQTLFVGPASLVVEGVTDYWYLTAIREFLGDKEMVTLPDDLVVTPAGGAQKVPYMVSLLSSQSMNVIVLLDGESSAQRTATEDLVKTKLIRSRDVLFVTDAFEADGRSEADIEDLLDPDVFARLAEESYARELEGVKLSLNHNIPRILKRYKTAFEEVGLKFHKTRPARLFLDEMGSAPETIMTEQANRRFERLFKRIKERREQQASRARTPFS